MITINASVLSDADAEIHITQDDASVHRHALQDRTFDCPTCAQLIRAARRGWEAGDRDDPQPYAGFEVT